MVRFLQLVWQTRDWPAVGLVMLILVVSGWCILLPFAPQLQTATMQRFHLSSSDYFRWACQQPIPSMYNLENRYWITDSSILVDSSGTALIAPAGFSEAIEPIDSGFANHFPTRVLTFGDGRHKYLSNSDRPIYLMVESRYRGRWLQTTFQCIPVSSERNKGGFKLIRIEQRYEPGRGEEPNVLSAAIEKERS